LSRVSEDRAKVEMRRGNECGWTVVQRVVGPRNLEDAEGLAHGALDVKRLDVLPVLLEERDEEVDRWNEKRKWSA
jgi:hypothetical protein